MHCETLEIPHEIQIQAAGKQGMELGGPAVRIEEAMVSLGNASAQPRAVVIVDRNAGVADATVEDSRRLYYVASWTFLALDLVLALLFLPLFADLHRPLALYVLGQRQ